MPIQCYLPENLCYLDFLSSHLLREFLLHPRGTFHKTGNQVQTNHTYAQSAQGFFKFLFTVFKSNLGAELKVSGSHSVVILLKMMNENEIGLLFADGLTDVAAKCNTASSAGS